MQNAGMSEKVDLECTEVSVAYFGLFAQSKHCGARETAVASERL
jgi:hypothetical protein